MRWLRIVLLPLLLLGAVYGACGFYYESNDDLTIVLLVRGITAAAPVSNLHVYLGWWGHFLAALYTWVPEFPWYDALLTLLVYVSLVVAFYVLEAIAWSEQRRWRTLVLELAFFGATYVPHLVQMNFTRPALLLGVVAGLLLALPTGGRRNAGRWAVAGLLFVAGWQLRSQAAELGALLTVPVLLLHSWRRALGALLGLMALVGLLILETKLEDSPAGATYVHINNIRTQAFDYQRYNFVLRTPADSLAYAALGMGMGPYDTGLVNEAFFQRCLRPAVSANGTTGRAVIQLIFNDLKQYQCLAAALTLYGWFLVMGALQRGALAGRQRAVWIFGLYQGFFWALYLGVALYFHPVPRVAHPMITAYLLTNLVMLHGFMGLDLSAPRPSRTESLGWGFILTSALLLTVVREWRVVRAIQASERNHAAYLVQLRNEAGGDILVEGGLYNVLDHLLLFKPYEFLAYRRIVTLGGWSIYDPSQPALRRYLTGQANTAEALLALGRQPRVMWVMQPAFAVSVAKYLNFRLRRPAGHPIRFVLANSQLPPGIGPRRYLFTEN